MKNSEILAEQELRDIYYDPSAAISLRKGYTRRRRSEAWA